MKTVLVWGTFDVLHLGHIHFLQKAKAQGHKLVVLISRDEIVKEIKGKLPLHNENERLEMIQALKCVDQAGLAGTEKDYKSLQEIKPDIICLGYDQTAFTEKLPEMLKKFGLSKTKIVRLDSTNPEKYKSTKIKERIKRD